MPTTQAARLVEFLLDEWSLGLRLTTIPQAMARLGIEDRVRLRWQVARSLAFRWKALLESREQRDRILKTLGREESEADHASWLDQVAEWSPLAYTLSNQEKLIARYILQYHERTTNLPAPDAIAQRLVTNWRTVQRALRMLALFGFVALPDARRLYHYGLTSDYQAHLRGLGFTFHTVTLETGEQFNVP